jgi:hypothetical protein
VLNKEKPHIQEAKQVVVDADKVIVEILIVHQVFRKFIEEMQQNFP